MAYDAEAAAKLVWTEVFNRPTGKNPRGIIAKYLRAAYAMQHDTDRLAFADAAERTLRRLDDWWLGLPPAVLGPQEQMLAAIIDEARALLATLTRVDGNESTKA